MSLALGHGIRSLLHFDGVPVIHPGQSFHCIEMAHFHQGLSFTYLIVNHTFFNILS